MILIPRPLVQPDPPDLAEQIEAKIAAMLAIPPVEPPPQKERKPRFRNGMEALAQWEADAAEKFLTMNASHQATTSTKP